MASELWPVREHPNLDAAPPVDLPVLVDGPTPFTLVEFRTVQKNGWPD